MLDRELLTKRTDLGTGPCGHAMTVQREADNPAPRRAELSTVRTPSTGMVTAG